MKKNTFFILFLFLLTFLSFAQAPANDACSGAITLTVDTPGNCINTLVTVNNATDSGFIDNSCDNDGSPDLWYILTAPESGFVRIETSSSGSIDDTVLSAYTGNNCGTLTPIGCNDDLASGISTFSRLEISEPEGTTIYIRVWDFDANTTGSFNICAQEIVLAENDDCENATSLATNATCVNITGSNESTDSTNNNDFGSCLASYEGSDVWFSVIVPSTGRFSVETSSTDGSITDTAMAIYSGSCPSGLTFLECSDDDGSGKFSFLELNDQTPTETLYVRVWSYANEEKGNFNICAVELPTLGVEEYSLNTNFTIYPNPANNYINFKFNNNYSGNVGISIYDLGGKLVFASNQEVFNNRTQINISNFLSGLYFVKVNDKKSNYSVRKLIVK